MGPLEWVRVLDCTSGSLTFAGGLLADCGASVTRVEGPGGDPDRVARPAMAAAYNRGKRSIVLDLEDGADRERFYELVRRSDVVLSDRDVASSLGLAVDAATLRRVNPALVHCSISGWGEGALDRDRPAPEELVMAWLGTFGEQAGSREGPVFEAMPMASTGVAFVAAIVVLAALYRRGVDGIGRAVETSLVDGALVYHTVMWQDADVPLGGPTKLATPTQRLSRMIGGYHQCADGKYLGVHTGGYGAFDRCVKAFGLEDRIPPSEDGRLFTPATMEEALIIENEVPGIFLRRPRDEWERILTEADVCVVPVEPPGEMFDNPQVRHNGLVVEVDDPVLGRIEQVGIGSKFERTPTAVSMPAPRVGEHTDEVLAEIGSRPPVVVEPSGTLRAGDSLLSGLRIIDAGAYYAGPYGPRLLAELGAEVVKVEPLGGDPLRSAPPGAVPDAPIRGKRSIAVDLKSEDGKAIAARLLAWADVVHHNMRPGAAERIGIGYDRAKQANPAVVYDFAPGWGGSGPYMARQGFAPMYSGLVGAAVEVAGAGNPPIIPAGHEDPGGGLMGALGILAALLHRQRTGEGQMIEHSQLNATVQHMRHVVRLVDGTVVGTAGLDGEQLGVGPLRRLYRTADGWICVVADEPGGFERLCAALGAPELAADERFAGVGRREAEAPVLVGELEKAFVGLTTADASTALDRAGVANEVPTLDNAQAFLNDPLQREVGRSQEWEDPRRGRVREVGFLWRVSDTTNPDVRRRPHIGEHTAAILHDVGFDPAEINRFYGNGAVV